MTTSSKPTVEPRKLHSEILDADEYQALCRLRQLKAQGAEFAIIILRAHKMKVRKVED